MTTDDDRFAYLSGEPTEDLDPDEQAELSALGDLLADPSLWADPDPQLEDRVVAAISAEAAGSPTASSAPERAGARRRRLLRYGPVGAAAAAAAAVALVVTGGGGTSAPKFAAALAPTGLVPGTGGTATLVRTDAGWRVELHTSGLPRLDNGSYYEAWLRNVGGTVVPIGTFNQGPVVTLWSGVSPRDFPTMTVTEQSTTANAAPGPRVLAGPVRPPA